MQIINQIRDPLSETTRKTRRNLLASSVIGISIVKIGLIPERITAFGIEATDIDSSALLIVISGIILYFGFSFITYMYSEWGTWKIADRYEIAELVRENEVSSAPIGSIQHHNARTQAIEFLNTLKQIKKSGNVYLTLRLVYEILIPITIGFWAIGLLLGNISLLSIITVLFL